LKLLTSTIAMTGTLVKQVNKGLASAITPSGTLAKQIQKALTSTITSAGTLAKQIQKALASSITPAGAFVRQLNKALTSTITVAGVLSKQAQKALTSAITPAGVIKKQVNKSLVSSITPAGTLAKLISRSFTSTIQLAGTLAKQYQRIFTSSIAPAGILRRQINKQLNSSITITGSITPIQLFGIVAAGTRSFWTRLRKRLIISPDRVNSLASPPRIRTLRVDLAMTTLQQYPDKGTYEKLAYTLDFVNELGNGETMSNPTVAVTVSSDSKVADGSPQSVYVTSSASVQGTKVGFSLQNGVNGCLYVISVKADTSTGQKLEARVLLRVTDATA
jgi:hypothetical protein